MANHVLKKKCYDEDMNSIEVNAVFTLKEIQNEAL